MPVLVIVAEHVNRCHSPSSFAKRGTPRELRLHTKKHRDVPNFSEV
jgi:hypothetical protein